MINADKKNYIFFTFGINNEYAQPELSKEPKGVINMAIYSISQNIASNIKYSEATYIGLTNDAKVNDTYVIQYGEKRLKVLYIQPKGKQKQVFLGEL